MNEFDHTNNSQVNNIYMDNNYKIIINNDKNSVDCTVVYCSSNGIYFPNTLDTFINAIVSNDRYEWSKKSNQLKNARKSIFIRDIYKQWYLKGVNEEINDLDKLIEFIQKEDTEDRLILVGTSSGGYVATLIGAKLNADMVFNFSGQLTLETVLNEGKDNIVNNLQYDWKHYYNLSSMLENTSADIFYFVCGNSAVDKEHILISEKYPSVKRFVFSCDTHGIPFPHICLKYLFLFKKDKLSSLSEFYSNKIIGSSSFWKHYISPTQYYFDNLIHIIKNFKKIPRYIIYKLKSES